MHKPRNEAIIRISKLLFTSQLHVSPPAVLTSESMLIIATHISAPFPLRSFGYFLRREFKCSSISVAVFITCWRFYLVKKFSSCTNGLPTLISWKAANGSVSDRVLLSSWDSKQAITAVLWPFILRLPSKPEGVVTYMSRVEAFATGIKIESSDQSPLGGPIKGSRWPPNC